MKKTLNSQKISKNPSANDLNQQKTLFQCWKSNSNVNTNKQESKTSNTSVNNSSYFNQSNLKSSLTNTDIRNELISINDDNEDDEDLELIQATETFLKSHNDTSTYFSNNSFKKPLDTTSNLDDDNSNDKLTIGIGDDVIKMTQFSDTTGFDFNSGSVWIYPNNMPIRSYQYNIVEQCLFKNTMVVLPTGLGKTFVAAVVMYNFYRWYPFGKVIFMAPTKPLVNQQSDACYKIVGIPKSEMCSMTGQMAPEKRKSLWNEKRVFFLTPQVIENDILRGTIDVNSIKCVVIDEAHKALGEYAFCKVVESINEVNKNFRIIALTATPGSDIKAVQNVINKLLISHIELRSDESIDIQQYNNHREVNKFVLTLNDEILKIRNVFYNVMRSPLKRLEMNRVLSCKDPGSLHKILILDRREQFRKNMSAGMDHRKSSLIECDLALLVTLIHALELLTQYGVKSFYMFLKSFIENIDGSKSASQQAKLRTEINNNSEMANYYELFKETFETKEKPVPKSLRHPKLLKLEEVILDHFKNFNKSDTRVMIFSQYRESVYEITEMLSEHTEIKPMEFVGQSSGQNSRKTVTQKEQLEVVKKFRDGGYNTLVSTCVGEEGLDIGEVDLIICYDSQKSPIRLIQRMGRTGRKREGKIVILLTEGKEENSYKTSLSKKKNIYKVILNGQKNFQFYQNNPLMIPKGLKPKCHKMFIELTKEEDEKDTTKINKKKEKSKKSDEVNNEDKKTKKTGKKSLKTKKKSDLSDSSFTSQNLPELNFDLSPTSTTTTTTNINNLSSNNKKDVSKIVNEKSRPAFESQLKLFNDSNFLNLSRKQTSSSLFNSSTHKYVSDPPNFKKLFKCLSKKPKENDETNIDDLSATFNLSECIKLWQSDEDDFILFNNDLTGDVNFGNKTCEQNLNESGLVEKFSKFYIQLTNDLSESEDDLEQQQVEHQPDSVSNQMIIDDTYSENQTNQNLESDKAIKEPTLNDLFMNCEDDEEDDDDLKYLNDANFNSCVQNYCINETINEDNVKFPIVNKGLTNLIKEEIKTESSPIVTKTTNSTSTPRSILKKNSKYQENHQETDNNNKISYSPLSYSPMCDNEKNNTTPNMSRRNLEVSFENKTQNQSMIGMTQAIDLINATCNMTPYNVNKKSPILNENINKNNSPVIVNLFDMKSNLDDLFNEDETDKENSISYSSINKEESIECIDLDNNNLNLINKARKLRFDEASILETSCVKPVKSNNKDDDDDDCFFIKKKKVSKDLSSSFSSQNINHKAQKNYSDDSEFDELIGNNNLNTNTQNIGQHYYYHQINDDDDDDKDNNDEENENEDDDDDFEQDFKRGKSKKKNKKSNFIIEEADLSGDDSGDSENDYEDDYDLKDSFVDNNEYSCNESMYLRYRESLNDVNQRPNYLNRKRAPITDDIFSQMPTQDSTYIHDSFCVPDDHVSIYEKKKSKKSKKSKKNADIKKSDKFKRIKNFNMTCVDENETNSILSDDKQQIQEDMDSFKMTQLPKKKKKIQDSFSEEKSDKTDELDDEELFIIESNLMKAKSNKDYNQSLMIIEPETKTKTKTDCYKNEVKSEINFEVNMVEDDEDDDFNQWLINDTFSESNLKPALCENDQFNSKNETILNENKNFLSKFNTVQNTVKKEAQIIKKENNTMNTTEINTPPPELPKNTNWLIVDASLLTSAADVIKHIRKLWQQDKVIIQTGICCDFIIGQRCAAIRLKWSELSSASNKDQIIEKFAKVKCLYPYVIVMVQDDRENNRGRTKLFDSVLANMAKITQILFSRYKTDDIVQQLYYLSKNEQQLGFDIDLDCNRLLEKRKKEISFYLTLPNISIVNALYLCKNYENINKLCNSSLEDLKTKGKMNDRKARKLLKFLIDS